MTNQLNEDEIEDFLFSLDKKIRQKHLRIRKPCKKFKNWRLEFRIGFAWNAIAQSWNEDFFKTSILSNSCKKYEIDPNTLKTV